MQNSIFTCQSNFCTNKIPKFEAKQLKKQRKFGGHATQKVTQKRPNLFLKGQRSTHKIVFGRNPNWVGGGVYLFLYTFETSLCAEKTQKSRD
jgi:hypothetical protein